MVIAHDLGGNAFSVSTALSEPALVNAASKYVTWEVVSLMAPIRDVVVKAGYSADSTPAAANRSVANVPTMSEFFDFLWLDRKYVLRKRRWP
jgi:hypothetical protein